MLRILYYRMAERNYRYKSDCEGVNLDDDNVYDYVLERDQFSQISHRDPRCMDDAFDVKAYDMKEHFGNLGSGISIWHVIFIALVIYIIYYLFFRGQQAGFGY